jgi:hypothetical protein
MMMMLPSTVTTVVVPPAFFTVFAVISVAIVDRGRRIDHRRRRLVDNRGWRYVNRPWCAEKYSNVHVS